MTPLTLPAWPAVAAEVGSVRRLLVGFSGGLDSTVLLILARQWSAQSGLPVLAVHVNHQLSPHAVHWQHHCQTLCVRWGIPFHAEAVNVANVGQGLEAAARNARYEVFAGIAQAGDLLLLGHHCDDQVETVFLRLLRGSGVLGLRGMDRFSPWRHLHVLRPLLHFSKAQLLDIVRSQQALTGEDWHWVEDESNFSDAFDRNYLRHRVLPLLETRWPRYAMAIERSAQHCADAQQLLDERAHEDLLARIRDDGGLLLIGDKSTALSHARQRNLLRYWLRCQQVKLPSEAQLDQILHTLIPAAEDGAPVVSWPGVDIRRYRQALYAVPPLSAPPQGVMVLPTLAHQVLPTGGMLIVCEQAGVHALRFHGLQARDITLRFRQGGETCKLAGRHTRPLKKILQASALPPWWRDRLPLIYINDELAAVPGVGVCEGYQAQPGEVGLCFRWQPPSLPQGWRDHSGWVGDAAGLRECVVKNTDF